LGIVCKIMKASKQITSSVSEVFQNIRYRLLLSYLAVLAVILGVFAIAVRTTFAHNLDQQLEHRLETLARAAALNLELEGGDLKVDNKSLAGTNQAVQWFDAKGRLLDEQGTYLMKLPFNPKQTIQTQVIPHPVKSFVLLIRDYETDLFIGYVRVSESTQDYKDAVQSLDWGLGVGVAMALALSGFGGIWLTRLTMQPIEQSFQRLQQFTSDASHELRSPLAAIQMNAEVALEYSEGIRDLDAEKFRAIESAATQLTALTEKLLLLARTDQAPRHQQEMVDLSVILEQLLQLYRPQFENKQIHLKAQLNEHLYVAGDQVQLSQLFNNLISNALRYTLAEGMVEIQANLEESHLVVSIKDTGIGIAPEHLNHVFERFWQVDQARSYHAGGFGLGLAIAQSIAQNHGGKIAITSELGQGSCFTVCLPTDPPQ
jgi:two-component system, OmpR family, manganese sensing sensor histidine kinase